MTAHVSGGNRLPVKIDNEQENNATSYSFCCGRIWKWDDDSRCGLYVITGMVLTVLAIETIPLVLLPMPVAVWPILIVGVSLPCMLFLAYVAGGRL